MILKSKATAQMGLAAGLVLLTSCATTSPHPQQFRSFFLPPTPAPIAVPPIELVEAPPLLANMFAAEVPNLSAAVPSIPRPSDTEFLIHRADERFAAGKKALREGNPEDARREFNRAVEILLGAPAETPDRPKLEQRLQEMVDSIYKYDTGELGANEPASQATFDDRPVDEIANMTFPVDPSLRNKVRAQIEATTSQLPLDATDAVVSYINSFSSQRGKKVLEVGMKRSGRYKPMIERVLREEGLPQELIFLAQAESGFKPQALSNKLCVGMWQFLKSRGEEYGLRVDSMVDMRMDPEAATRAAARHLHDLYTHLGDWNLAMAAYDCGEGCINQRVEHTGYADYWELKRLGVLPGETSNYVPIILAMITVAKNAKDYGVDVEYDPALEYDSIELESTTQLSLVASALDRPLSDLKELNPAVLHQVAPAGYMLHVPKGTLERVEQAFSVIPASHRDSWRVHRVEEGDTLATLAKKYSISESSIRSVNREDLPEPGQFAAIPVSYPSDRPAARAGAKKKSSTAAAAALATAGKKPVAQAPKKAPVRKAATAARPGA